MRKTLAPTHRLTIDHDHTRRSCFHHRTDLAEEMSDLVTAGWSALVHADAEGVWGT
jgi:hypothetical protein